MEADGGSPTVQRTELNLWLTFAVYCTVLSSLISCVEMKKVATFIYDIVAVLFSCFLTFFYYTALRALRQETYSSRRGGRRGVKEKKTSEARKKVGPSVFRESAAHRWAKRDEERGCRRCRGCRRRGRRSWPPGTSVQRVRRPLLHVGARRADIDARN